MITKGDPKMSNIEFHVKALEERKRKQELAITENLIAQNKYENPILKRFGLKENVLFNATNGELLELIKLLHEIIDQNDIINNI